MEAKVDFTACDNPTANRITLHILAAVAENEVKAISDRTKAALQAAKRRGVKLGSAREGHWEGIEEKRLAGAAEGRKVAARVNHERGREAIADLLPTMTSLRNQGKTYQEIADALNADGATTSRGNPWNAMLARNSMIRFGS
jgi:DNA invertase Pin-like site-specific DNA recombinase